MTILIFSASEIVGSQLLCELNLQLIFFLVLIFSEWTLRDAVGQVKTNRNSVLGGAFLHSALYWADIL